MKYEKHALKGHVGFLGLERAAAGRAVQGLWTYAMPYQPLAALAPPFFLKGKYPLCNSDNLD